MSRMVKRTTVLLENSVYDALVKESLEEYKNTRSVSKIMNEILKKSLTNRGRLMSLIYSRKVARTTAKGFEKFRSGLSSSV